MIVRPGDMIVLRWNRVVWRTFYPKSSDVLFEDVPLGDPVSREPEAFLIIAVTERTGAGWICVLLRGRCGWITVRAGDTVIP